jgi:deazaflavin-dependent oxidoreductase (nitroreductase family)
MSESGYTAPDLSLVGESHIKAYRETNGDVGYLWNGVPTLLLTTMGRRTGEPRTSALIFARNTDDFLVVASMGGAPRHPQWYLNLTANPAAEIQVRADHSPVVAHPATPAEKPRLWRVVTGVWPNYEVYQGRTAREIPVVVLSPV